MFLFQVVHRSLTRKYGVPQQELARIQQRTTTKNLQDVKSEALGVTTGLSLKYQQGLTWGQYDGVNKELFYTLKKDDKETGMGHYSPRTLRGIPLPHLPSRPLLVKQAKKIAEKEGAIVVQEGSTNTGWRCSLTLTIKQQVSQLTLESQEHVKLHGLDVQVSFFFLKKNCLLF